MMQSAIALGFLNTTVCGLKERTLRSSSNVIDQQFRKLVEKSPQTKKSI